MKYAIIFLLFFCCFPANATELSTVQEHANGWSFLFYSGQIKSSQFPGGHKYPIEIPLKKCKPSNAVLVCFATEQEAKRFAHTKAIESEKLMKQALGG